MRTMLFAACFASALVAAPAPVGVKPPAFGSTGILTLDDLKGLPFQSRILKTDAERKELKLSPELQPDAYDVAVHMPQIRIAAGEPIPVYFLIKNKRDKPLGLQALLRLEGSQPHTQGECRFSLHARETREPALVLMMHSTHCGGGSLAEVPANGFYVVKADLSPLPVGEYDVEWSYLYRASAPVRFTVTDGRATPQLKPARTHSRLLALRPDDSEASADDDTFLWKSSELEDIHWERATAAFAVGPFGTFIPDIRTIPASDGGLEIRSSLRTEADREVLIVTFVSPNPKKPVRFADVPHLYLQVEMTGTRDGARLSKMADKQEKLRRIDDPYRTPLTIEVPLEKDWRKNCGLEGSGRLAVIATSGEVKFPEGGHRQERLEMREEKSLKRERLDEAKVWSGVIRSAFLPLNEKKP